MIHLQRLKFGKPREFAGKRSKKDGTQTSQTVEQMTQEMAHVFGRGLRLWLPGQAGGGNHADEVLGALDLFAQLQVNIMGDGLLRHDSECFIVNEAAG